MVLAGRAGDATEGMPRSPADTRHTEDVVPLPRSPGIVIACATPCTRLNESYAANFGTNANRQVLTPEGLYATASR